MEPDEEDRHRRAFDEDCEERDFPRRRKGHGRGVALIFAGLLVLLALAAASAILVTPFVLHFKGDSKMWPYDEEELRIEVEDSNSGGDPVVLYKQLTTEYKIPINDTFWSKSGSSESMDHLIRRILTEVEDVTGLDLHGDVAADKDLVELRGVFRGVRVQNGYELEACTAYDFQQPKWCKNYESGSYDEADLDASGYSLADCEPQSSIELRLRRWEAILLPEGVTDSRSELEIRSVDDDQREAMARPFEPTYQLADTCTYNIEEDVFSDCRRRYSAMSTIVTISDVEISSCKDVMRFFPACFDTKEAPFDSSYKNNEVSQKGSSSAEGGHVLLQDIRYALDKRNGIQFQLISAVEYDSLALALEGVKPSTAGFVTMRVWAPKGGLGPWDDSLSVVTESWFTQLLASFGEDAALPC